MKIEIEYAFFLCIYMYIQAAAAFYTEKKSLADILQITILRSLKIF